MRKFFLSVQMYTTTTKLGKLVGVEVFEKYNCSLVYEGQVMEIVGFIEKTMNKHLEKTPQLKPMRAKLMNFGDIFTLEFKPERDKTGEKCAFVVRGRLVMNDYTSIEKGGEA